MAKHAFENPYRAPIEWLVAIVSLIFGLLIFWQPVTLTQHTAQFLTLVFVAFAFYRGYQAYRIIRFRHALLVLKPFSLGTVDVPLSKERLYLGQGFRWQPVHRQRLHLLTQAAQQSLIYQKRFDQLSTTIGGKPWLHGVGFDQEQAITLPQANRNSHTVVFGMTRVGKTRLMSILVNQDIRNGEAVLVLDPKGDLNLIQDMYAACQSVGRLSDFKILHAGRPDLSAKYNPLINYSHVSEVATRVTSAIQAEGEGKQFQDFAWKFLNTTATCLAEMGEPITYQSLAFFATRPGQLLLSYCDKILPQKDPLYLEKVESILNESTQDKKGKKQEPLSRSDAVKKYMAQYIESIISQGDHRKLHDALIVDLHYASQLNQEYYSKITASLSPVFDKINKTNAGKIFSWEDSEGLSTIQLDEVIARKQVVYIGLDAMSNKAMSDAIGQATIADLISLCGRLYKSTPNSDRVLCLHADEFSEIVRDEFVTLLNKAGGAGVRVTAYTQTVNDLGVPFGINKDKPKMLLGNFGTMIMLRVANLDTATLFTECLETCIARHTSPSTITNDKETHQGAALFTTVNADLINETEISLIAVNDLFSLPKGQAYVLTNGGELFKIRIPLPKISGKALPNLDSILLEVNQCLKNYFLYQ